MRAVFFIALCTIIASCHNSHRPTRAKCPTHPPLPEPAIFQQHLTYLIDSFPDKASVDSFIHRYKPEDLVSILNFNRIDRKFLKPGKKLVIPSIIFPSFADYSTYPSELSFADTIQKLAIVSLRNQSFAIYEYGKIVRTGPCSSGKKSAPTPAGLYHTNWRKRVKKSTINRKWTMPWYFNIQNREGIAFHQYEMPGYAASHACIRLHKDDAIWIYNWATPWKLADEGHTIVRNGTPVILFGNYDHQHDPAWFRLPENPDAMQITDADLQQINDFLLQRDTLKG